MKSIKRGRGPSMMQGAGSVFAAIFGVLWTIMAASMGAPPIFALFGVCFIGIAVIQAIYNFKNASSDQRFSEFDIVDSREEGDPLDAYLKRDESKPNLSQADETESSGDGLPQSLDGGFCPYCGEAVNSDYVFCRKCGKKLQKL